MFSIAGSGWIIPNLESVIFDKDGTIVDVHLYWGEIIRRRSLAAIAHYRLPPDSFPRLCGSMGLSLADNRLLPQGPVGLTSRDEVIQALCHCLDGLGVVNSGEAVGDLFTQVHEAFLPDIDRYLQLIPGVFECISAMRQAGAKLAVVTSDTAVNTCETLKKLGLSSCFDVIMGRDMTPEPKISGVPARKALKMMGQSAERTVCLGDAPMDFLMAEKSGCRAGIGVATGQTPIAELSRHTAYTVLSMQDLIVERVL
ncbi:MAG: HAD family hydrolase [bacterium]